MKILLVEDDTALAHALMRSLADSDFETTPATNLGSALQLYSMYAFHCVLLDLNLPDGEGFELLKRVQDNRARTPVIVMTARSALTDRLRALNDGADDYLIKPFATEELIARVRVAIRRSGGFSASTWQLGKLCIDLLAQQATIAETSVQLTPREFAILRELALAQGRIVRRETLIDRVWGINEHPSDGALEFQIHGLRKKIGGDMIRTVRGIGYTLMNDAADRTP